MPRIVKLYYVQRFFYHLNFFWAVDKVFFASKGISPFQLSVLLAAWSAYVLIFEIPSGAIADRWSRRWVMSIGSLFYTLSHVVWLFANGFWGFLIGYLFRGTGGFLQSGTKEALFYDHLKALGKESDYEKYNGKLWIVTSVAFLVASLTAGFIASTYSFSVILGMTIISNVIAFIFTFAIPDAPRMTSTEELSYWKFMKSACQKALKNPWLLRAIFYAVTVIAVASVLDEYDQVYVSAVGLQLTTFGVWWALRMGSEIIAGTVSHKFKSYGRERVLETSVYVSLGLLILTALINSVYIVGVLALYFFVSAVSIILNEGRMQSLVESHERATVNSINSLLKQLSGIIIGLSFGYVADSVNPRIAMLVFVFVLVAYLLSKMIVRTRRRMLVNTS